MKKIRAFKYKINPNEEQKTMINRTFGCVRYVHNLYVDDIKNNKNTNMLAKDLLNIYKKEAPFLSEVDNSALMNRLLQLQKCDYLTLGYYRKGDKQSYTTTNLQFKKEIYIVEDKYVHLPKIGSVEIVYSRKIPKNCVIRNATIMFNNLRNYYISILIEYDEELNNSVDVENSIGLDYSSANLYVDNNGETAQMPKFYKAKEKQISKEISKLYRMEFNGSNYKKQKIKIGKLYQKTKNQRYDYLHKLSTQLAGKYDYIFVEDLNMNDMAHNFKLAKPTYDNSYGQFLQMLSYKLEGQGKHLVKVARSFPSSKMCSNCGSINYSLTINERKWTCKDCGYTHNRDINAAINIRNEGIRMTQLP